MKRAELVAMRQSQVAFTASVRQAASDAKATDDTIALVSGATSTDLESIRSRLDDIEAQLP